MQDTEGNNLRVGDFYEVDVGNIRLRGMLLWDNLGKEWCLCCSEADIRYPIRCEDKLYHVTFEEL